MKKTTIKRIIYNVIWIMSSILVIFEIGVGVIHPFLSQIELLKTNVILYGVIPIIWILIICILFIIFTSFETEK